MAAQSVALAGLQATAQISTDTPLAAGAVGVNITGTFVGTLVFEASTDNTNWFAVAGLPVLAAGILGGAALSTTVTGAWSIPVGGYAAVRVRMSAYTSGTAQVGLDSSAAAPSPFLGNAEGQKASYAGAVNAFAPQATPQDWFTITGSATKTVRITRLAVTLRATAVTQYRVSLIKYSTAISAGTPAAVTLVPHDGNDAAATASVQTWNGGQGTAGSAVGKLADDSLPVAALGTPGSGSLANPYDFGIRPSRSIVLRGVAQYVALNSAGVALPSGLVADVKVELTEE